MATINVFLPASMKEWVEAQAETDRYSDYVCALIHRDQERNNKITAMQRFIDDGLKSGVGTLSSDELFSIALAR
jgi:antitoxin ParD1/3/4